MHVTVFSIYYTTLSAIALASATAAASASLSSLALETPSITSNVTVTGGRPRPKSYHVPNTPITLLFTNYDRPPGLTATSVYQALVKSFYAVYYNAQPPKTGSSFIGVEAISWTFGGVQIRIGNYGSQGVRLITWTILADMILGVATFLEDEGCLQAEWAISDSPLGTIGYGYIGRDLGVTGGNLSAAAVVEAA